LDCGAAFLEPPFQHRRETYPDRVTGVVVQNTPTFGEPTDGPLWAAELAYWKAGSSAHRDAVRSKLTPEAVRSQYLAGTREPSLIDPDNWTIDSALLAPSLVIFGSPSRLPVGACVRLPLANLLVRSSSV